MVGLRLHGGRYGWRVGCVVWWSVGVMDQRANRVEI